MKPLFRISLVLCALVLAGAGCSRSSVKGPGRVADPTNGRLIKGTSITTVYYLGRNERRYVFPNDKTYLTWFPSFSYVRQIADAELIKTPLGGNVTYKPGSRLLKIDTDPSVYVVTHGGVLRKLANEDVAAQLFGTNWKTLVDDMPDPFFVNYQLGEPITAASQLSLESITKNSENIDDDKGLPSVVSSTTP